VRAAPGRPSQREGTTQFPLALGPDGREPWYAGYQRAGLDLLTTSVLDDRIVLLEYERAG